MYRRY